MANIKDLKKKIKTTKSTLKITSAMKLVSAAKLLRAQAAIMNSRPYADELEETIKIISALIQDYSHEYLEEQENNRAMLLVISADRGLCGGYNSQLARTVRQFLEETNLDMQVSFIGRKVRDVIKNEIDLYKTFTFKKNEGSFPEVKSVAMELADLFSKNEVGKIYVAYNVFKSALTFIPTIKQVLPFSLDESEKKELSEKFPFDFKYAPQPAKILDSLIPETYVNAIYTCLLDAYAAEHGSRMTSMDSAANNCKEVIRTLTLKMNKLRQAAITTELIEVVSGAESLNG